MLIGLLFAEVESAIIKSDLWRESGGIFLPTEVFYSEIPFRVSKHHVSVLIWGKGVFSSFVLS